MLRRTVATLMVVPTGSREATLPNFLSTPTQHVHSVDGNLFQFVLEHDHGKPMTEYFCTERHSTFFASRPFSGSTVAATTTFGGVALFCLCFGYLVGKPVVDAHREHFYGSLNMDEEAITDGSGPIEEEGDHID